MPLVDMLFKSVELDNVGLIDPLSEAGHRYILTLVDYATRYPEAVPLKKITTEAVADALLDIYTRVGIPEEVLTNTMINSVLFAYREVPQESTGFSPLFQWQEILSKITFTKGYKQIPAPPEDVYKTAFVTED